MSNPYIDGINQVNDVSGSLTTTITLNTTQPGDVLLIACYFNIANGGGRTAAVADNSGITANSGTWTLIGSQTNSGIGCFVFYTTVNSGHTFTNSATITVTWGDTPTSANLTVWGLAGANVSSVLDGSAVTGTTSSLSITTSNAADILFACWNGALGGPQWQAINTNTNGGAFAAFAQTLAEWQLTQLGAGTYIASVPAGLSQGAAVVFAVKAASALTPQLFFDGFTNDTSNDAASLTGEITTQYAGDIIVVCVTNTCSGNYATSAVSDTVNGSYNLRNLVQYDQGGNFVDSRIFWVYSATALSAVTITAAFTLGGGATQESSNFLAFALSGFLGTAYKTNPWDVTAATALGWSADSTSGTPSAPTSNNLATMQANDFIFAFCGTADANTSDLLNGTICGATATLALQELEEFSTNDSQLSVIFGLFSSAQSGSDASFSSDVAGWAIMPDAIFIGQATPPPVSGTVGLVGFAACEWHHKSMTGWEREPRSRIYRPKHSRRIVMPWE